MFLKCKQRRWKKPMKNFILSKVVGQSLLIIMDVLTGIFKDFFDAFSQCSHFIPPEMIKKPFGFLFSGSIKREHCKETG